MKKFHVLLVVLASSLGTSGCETCPDGSRTWAWLDCAPPNPDPPPGSCDLSEAVFEGRPGLEPLAIEMGGGQAGFEDLPDGGSVALSFGAQGGTHIWTSIRVHDNRADRASVRLRALAFVDGGAPQEDVSPLDLVRCAGLLPKTGTPQERVGLTNFTTANAGDTVLMLADVASPDGRVGHARRVVHLR